MTEILNMGWPFATVLIAAVIALVVIYGIHTAARDQDNAK